MQPPPLYHCALNFVPLNVVGNAKIRMYTWIMILEAWNLHKMITAGKYLANLSFWKLVGWLGGLGVWVCLQIINCIATEVVHLKALSVYNFFTLLISEHLPCKSYNATWRRITKAHCRLFPPSIMQCPMLPTDQHSQQLLVFTSIISQTKPFLMENFKCNFKLNESLWLPGDTCDSGDAT